MELQLIKRKNVRLVNYDYSQNGLYFITICTKNRKCILGEIKNGKMSLSTNGQIVDNCWNDIPKHFSQAILHENVIMPNHIHGIIEINDPSMVVIVGAKHLSPVYDLKRANNDIKRANNDLPLRGTSQTIGSIIRGFKIGVTKQIGFSPWQRNYYEHVIRSEMEYTRIANYIIENPLQWCGNRNNFISL